MHLLLYRELRFIHMPIIQEKKFIYVTVPIQPSKYQQCGMHAEVRKKIQFSYLSKLFYKRMEHCPMDLLCFHGTRCCVWTKDEFFFLPALVHQKCNIDLYVNHIGTYRGHFSHGSHCHQNSWLEGQVPPAQHSGLNCTLPAM